MSLTYSQQTKKKPCGREKKEKETKQKTYSIQPMHDLVTHAYGSLAG
jgi:hypothetical protein